MTRSSALAKTAALILAGALFASGVNTALATNGDGSAVATFSVSERLAAGILGQ
ncbi:MAG: hypothetical protein AAF401_03950 [Pseudomonadota bacterium]